MKAHDGLSAAGSASDSHRCSTFFIENVPESGTFHPQVRRSEFAPVGGHPEKHESAIGVHGGETQAGQIYSERTNNGKTHDDTAGAIDSRRLLDAHSKAKRVDQRTIRI